MTQTAGGTRTLGALGEILACRYLMQEGYRVLVRNYVSPSGEIDVVARDGDVLAFVEVKSRRSFSAGLPEESVTGWKRRQIARAASFYLARYGPRDVACRFDVVSVRFLGEAVEIELIRDAFIT